MSADFAGQSVEKNVEEFEGMEPGGAEVKKSEMEHLTSTADDDMLNAGLLRDVAEKVLV